MDSLLKTIIGGLAIASVSSAGAWVYHTGAEMKKMDSEIKILGQLISNNTISDQKVIDQMTEYNKELTSLVSQAELRLARMEAVWEHVLKDK